jgi:hypothetical protein
MPVTTTETLTRQPRFEIRGDVGTENIVEGTRVRRRREAYLTELGQPDKYVGYWLAFTTVTLHKEAITYPDDNKIIAFLHKASQNSTSASLSSLRGRLVNAESALRYSPLKVLSRPNFEAPTT